MGRANEGSFKNYEHTTAGFSAAMHDTWDKLSAHLMKPIFNSHKSGLADLTKMVQSKDIQKGAEAIGQGLSSIMSAASKQLNSFAKYAQSHKTQLKAGLNEIKGSLTNVWNFAKPILSFLTTHPKILAGVATGFLGIAAALKVTTTAMAIAKIGVNGLKMALISSGIGIAVAAIGIAAVELITHWKQVKAFFGGLGSWFKGIWHGITSGISSFVSGVSKKWNGFANGTKDKFNDARKSAVSATNSMVNQVANKHSWLNQHTNGAASDMFKGLKKTFKNGYNTMHDYTNTWSDVIHGRWSKVGGDIGQTAKDAMKTAKSAFHTGYGVLNDLTGGWLGKTVGWFEDLPGRIAKGVKKGWKTIEQAFIDLGNGMIRGIGKGVNGVIGGIDWILDKVKAPEIKPWKVPQFANGGLASGLSVVGEKGKHELIKHDDGTMELSPNKATLYNFKKPVQILGGDKTEQLMKMLPKFGIGTWLGSAVDFVKGGFNAISSSADNFWNAITHPAQLLNTAIDKFTDLSGLNGTIADMAKGTVTYAAKESLNWIKKIFDSESADPTGTGVKRWTTDVHKTLSMLDLSQSLTAKVLKQISTESGGNAKALGGDDGLNDGRAMGLMQVKPGTFSAYHLSGHNDIWNGFDNMLAGLNYAKHRYGSGLSYLGHGHGYANGGLVTQHQIAELAEGNKAEMVVPLTNTTRSIQLLSQATDYLATKLGIKQQSNDSSQAVSNTISMPINITINGNTDQNTAKQLAQMVAKQLNNTLKAQGLKLV
jgi:SLT domain-containing protein